MADAAVGDAVAAPSEAAACVVPPANPANADAACAEAGTSSQVVPSGLDAVERQCGVDGGLPPAQGPVPPSTILPLAIGLPAQGDLKGYSDEVSNPASPCYRHYLTPDQITAAFSPSACDYDAVVAWARGSGFDVTQTSSDRLLLSVNATAAQVAAAFHVTLSYYPRPDGSQFWSADRDPSVDLSIPLLEITGLDNCAAPH